MYSGRYLATIYMPHYLLRTMKNKKLGNARSRCLCRFWSLIGLSPLRRATILCETPARSNYLFSKHAAGRGQTAPRNVLLFVQFEPKYQEVDKYYRNTLTKSHENLFRAVLELLHADRLTQLYITKKTDPTFWNHFAFCINNVFNVCLYFPALVRYSPV
jgi:hypothetical protein